MVQQTLIIGVLLDIATAAMLLYVGFRVARLPHPGRGLRPSLWFWAGGAVFMLLDGGFGLVVLGFDVPLWVGTAVLIVRRMAFSAGWMAFGAWLLALNGGRYTREWWAYTSLLLGAIFIQTWLQGVGGYEVRPWSVALLPAQPSPLWLNVLFGLGLFVPPGWQAVRLLRWLPHWTRVQRFRGTAIGVSTLLFCALIIAGFVNNSWFLYGLLENRSMFAVATGVLVAMRPPRWLRSKGIPRMTSATEFPGRPAPAAA